VLTLLAVWVDLPNNPGIRWSFFGQRVERDLRFHLGLDLQGGLQVTLEADPPAGVTLTRDHLTAARDIIENRINALGVAEPVIQPVGEQRIIVELPGIRDPERAIQTFGGTGLLEFIDAGTTALTVGQVVTTTLGGFETVGRTDKAEPSVPDASPTPTAPITSTGPLNGVFPTVVTGADLRDAKVDFDNLGRPRIAFSLKPEGANKFAEFTKANVGKFLAIVMDKSVISSPVVKSPITEGEGVIEGDFALQEAQSIVVQLKYGALPVPLRILETRSVGPTLGQDSVQKSLLAGVIGLGTVAFFMIAFYHFPGLLAVFALLIYAAVVSALFKLIPVVLTLAGIAGFILSVGMAVDANILIFERMREELRGGKPLGAAIEAGFARAWTSIRDSNISTLITCAILYWFGANFRASIIQGFALTLAIGVLVSMFTAITVSRNFLRVSEYLIARNPGLGRVLLRLW